MRLRRRSPLFWLLCTLALAPSRAQQPSEPLDPRPVVGVPRTPRRPVLEDFLDMRPPEDLAPVLERVRGFVQQVPEDGQPATQETDVYLGHDDEQLYVIFVAWDAEPQKIRAHISRREQFFADETVEIQIDSFDGGQRAY